MLANLVSFMEINIYIQTLSLHSDEEGELVLLRNPVSSFTLFCYLCNVHRVQMFNWIAHI